MPAAGEQVLIRVKLGIVDDLAPEVQEQLKNLRKIVENFNLEINFGVKEGFFRRVDKALKALKIAAKSLQKVMSDEGAIVIKLNDEDIQKFKTAAETLFIEALTRAQPEFKKLTKIVARELRKGLVESADAFTASLSDDLSIAAERFAGVASDGFESAIASLSDDFTLMGERLARPLEEALAKIPSRIPRSVTAAAPTTTTTTTATTSSATGTAADEAQKASEIVIRSAQDVDVAIALLRSEIGNLDRSISESVGRSIAVFGELSRVFRSTAITTGKSAKDLGDEFAGLFRTANKEAEAEKRRLISSLTEILEAARSIQVAAASTPGTSQQTDVAASLARDELAEVTQRLGKEQLIAGKSALVAASQQKIATRRLRSQAEAAGFVEQSIVQLRKSITTLDSASLKGLLTKYRTLGQLLSRDVREVEDLDRLISELLTLEQRRLRERQKSLLIAQKEVQATKDQIAAKGTSPFLEDELQVRERRVALLADEVAAISGLVAKREQELTSNRRLLVAINDEIESVEHRKDAVRAHTRVLDEDLRQEEAVRRKVNASELAYVSLTQSVKDLSNAIQSAPPADGRLISTENLDRVEVVLKRVNDGLVSSKNLLVQLRVAGENTLNRIREMWERVRESQGGFLTSQQQLDFDSEIAEATRFGDTLEDMASKAVASFERLNASSRIEAFRGFVQNAESFDRLSDAIVKVEGRFTSLTDRLRRLDTLSVELTPQQLAVEVNKLDREITQLLPDLQKLRGEFVATADRGDISTVQLLQLTDAIDELQKKARTLSLTDGTQDDAQDIVKLADLYQFLDLGITNVSDKLVRLGLRLDESRQALARGGDGALEAQRGFSAVGREVGQLEDLLADLSIRFQLAEAAGQPFSQEQRRAAERISDFRGELARLSGDLRDVEAAGRFQAEIDKTGQRVEVLASRIVELGRISNQLAPQELAAEFDKVDREISQLVPGIQKLNSELVVAKTNGEISTSTFFKLSSVLFKLRKDSSNLDLTGGAGDDTRDIVRLADLYDFLDRGIEDVDERLLRVTSQFTKANQAMAQGGASSLVAQRGFASVKREVGQLEDFLSALSDRFQRAADAGRPFSDSQRRAAARIEEVRGELSQLDAELASVDAVDRLQKSFASASERVVVLTERLADLRTLSNQLTPQQLATEFDKIEKEIRQLIPSVQKLGGELTSAQQSGEITGREFIRLSNILDALRTKAASLDITQGTSEGTRDIVRLADLYDFLDRGVEDLDDTILRITSQFDKVNQAMARGGAGALVAQRGFASVKREVGQLEDFLSNLADRFQRAEAAGQPFSDSQRRAAARIQEVRDEISQLNTEIAGVAAVERLQRSFESASERILVLTERIADLNLVSKQLTPQQLATEFDKIEKEIKQLVPSVQKLGGELTVAQQSGEITGREFIRLSNVLDDLRVRAANIDLTGGVADDTREIVRLADLYDFLDRGIEDVDEALVRMTSRLQQTNRALELGGAGALEAQRGFATIKREVGQLEDLLSNLSDRFQRAEAAGRPFSQAQRAAADRISEVRRELVALNTELESQSSFDRFQTATSKLDNRLLSLEERLRQLKSLSNTLTPQQLAAEFNKLDKEIAKLVPDIQKMNGEFVAARLAGEITDNQLQQLLGTLSALSGKGRALSLTDGTQDDAREVAKLADLYEFLDVGIGDVADRMARLSAQFLRNTQILRQNNAGAIQAQKGFGTIKRELGQLEDTLAALETRYELAAAAGRPFTAQQQLAADRIRQTRDEVARYNEALARNLPFINRQAQSQKDAGNRFRLYNDQLVSSIQNNFKFINALTIITSALFLLRTALFQIIEESRAFARTLTVLQSRVVSISEAFTRFKEEARAAAIEFGVEITQVAEVVKQFGSAGLSAEESLAGLRSALRLIISTNADGETAARQIAGVYNVFGDQLSEAGDQAAAFGKITDTLTSVYRNNQAELDELVQGLQFSAAAGKVAGFSFQEISGFLAILNDNLIKSGKAGRGLQVIFAQFAAKSDRFADAFGVAVDPQRPVAEQFISVLEQINQRLSIGALTTAELSKQFEFFGLRGARSFITLVKNVDDVKDAIDRLEDAGGTSALLSGLVQGELANQFERAKNILLEFGREIVEPLRDVMVSLADVLVQLKQGFEAIPFAGAGWITFFGVVAVGVAILQSAVAIARVVHSTWLLMQDGAFGAAAGARSLWGQLTALTSAQVRHNQVVTQGNALQQQQTLLMWQTAGAASGAGAGAGEAGKGLDKAAKGGGKAAAIAGVLIATLPLVVALFGELNTTVADAEENFRKLDGQIVDLTERRRSLDDFGASFRRLTRRFDAGLISSRVGAEQLQEALEKAGTAIDSVSLRRLSPEDLAAQFPAAIRGLERQLELEEKITEERLRRFEESRRQAGERRLQERFEGSIIDPDSRDPDKVVRALIETNKLLFNQNQTEEDLADRIAELAQQRPGRFTPLRQEAQRIQDLLKGFEDSDRSKELLDAVREGRENANRDLLRALRQENERIADRELTDFEEIIRESGIALNDGLEKLSRVVFERSLDSLKPQSREIIDFFGVGLPREINRSFRRFETPSLDLFGEIRAESLRSIESLESAIPQDIFEGILDSAERTEEGLSRLDLTFLTGGELTDFEDSVSAVLENLISQAAQLDEGLEQLGKISVGTPEVSNIERQISAVRRLRQQIGREAEASIQDVADLFEDQEFEIKVDDVAVPFSPELKISDKETQNALRGLLALYEKNLSQSTTRGIVQGVTTFREDGEPILDFGALRVELQAVAEIFDGQRDIVADFLVGVRELEDVKLFEGQLALLRSLQKEARAAALEIKTNNNTLGKLNDQQLANHQAEEVLLRKRNDFLRRQKAQTLDEAAINEIAKIREEATSRGRPQTDEEQEDLEKEVKFRLQESKVLQEINSFRDEGLKTDIDILNTGRQINVEEATRLGRSSELGLLRRQILEANEGEFSQLLDQLAVLKQQEAAQARILALEGELKGNKLERLDAENKLRAISNDRLKLTEQRVKILEREDILRLDTVARAQQILNADSKTAGVRFRLQAGALRLNALNRRYAQLNTRNIKSEEDLLELQSEKLKTFTDFIDAADDLLKIQEELKKLEDTRNDGLQKQLSILREIEGIFTEEQDKIRERLVASLQSSLDASPFNTLVEAAAQLGISFNQAKALGSELGEVLVKNFEDGKITLDGFGRSVSGVADQFDEISTGTDRVASRVEKLRAEIEKSSFESAVSFLREGQFDEAQQAIDSARAAISESKGTDTVKVLGLEKILALQKQLDQARLGEATKIRAEFELANEESILEFFDKLRDRIKELTNEQIKVGVVVDDDLNVIVTGGITDSVRDNTTALQELSVAFDRFTTTIGVFAGAPISKPVKPKKFRTGGLVPGTGSGDKVPAMLEPGEFVIPKEQVARLGVSFLESLRGGRVMSLQDGGEAERAARMFQPLTTSVSAAISREEISDRDRREFLSFYRSVANSSESFKFLLNQAGNLAEANFRFSNVEGLEGFFDVDKNELTAARSAIPQGVPIGSWLDADSFNPTPIHELVHKVGFDRVVEQARKEDFLGSSLDDPELYHRFFMRRIHRGNLSRGRYIQDSLAGEYEAEQWANRVRLESLQVAADGFVRGLGSKIEELSQSHRATLMATASLGIVGPSIENLAKAETERWFANTAGTYTALAGSNWAKLLEHLEGASALLRFSQTADSETAKDRARDSFQDTLLYKLQEGGHIPGFGGGDRIPAMLEAGEFVMPKESVAKFGVGFFEQLRRGSIPAFQDGGQVDPLATPVQPLNILRRTTEGQQKTISATEEILNLSPGEHAEFFRSITEGLGKVKEFGVQALRVAIATPPRFRSEMQIADKAISDFRTFALRSVTELGDEVAIANQEAQEPQGFQEGGFIRALGASANKGAEAIQHIPTVLDGFRDAQMAAMGDLLDNAPLGPELRSLAFKGATRLLRTSQTFRRSSQSIKTDISRLESNLVSAYSSISGVNDRLAGTVLEFEDGAPQIVKMQSGGALPGFGGGDKIPAMLEAGEFVMPKESVAKFGVGFFEQLRMGNIPGFQNGGQVGGSGGVTSIGNLAAQLEGPFTSAQLKTIPVLAGAVREAVKDGVVAGNKTLVSAILTATNARIERPGRLGGEAGTGVIESAQSLIDHIGDAATVQGAELASEVSQLSEMMAAQSAALEEHFSGFIGSFEGVAKEFGEVEVVLSNFPEFPEAPLELIDDTSLTKALAKAAVAAGEVKETLGKAFADLDIPGLDGDIVKTFIKTMKSGLDTIGDAFVEILSFGFIVEGGKAIAEAITAFEDASKDISRTFQDAISTAETSLQRNETDFLSFIDSVQSAEQEMFQQRLEAERQLREELEKTQEIFRQALTEKLGAATAVVADGFKAITPNFEVFSESLETALLVQGQRGKANRRAGLERADLTNRIDQVRLAGGTIELSPAQAKRLDDLQSLELLEELSDTQKQELESLQAGEKTRQEIAKQQAVVAAADRQAAALGEASVAAIGKTVGLAVAGAVSGLLNLVVSGVQSLIGFAFDLDGLNRAIQGFETFAQDFAANAPQIVKGLIAGASAFIQAIVDNLPAILEALTEALPELIIGVTEILAEKLPVIIEQLGEALPGLIKALVPALADLAVVLIEQIPAIVEALAAALPVLIVELVKAAPKIMIAIAGVLIDIIPAIIKGLLEGIGQLLIDGLEKLGLKGIAKAVGAIVKGLKWLVDTVQMVFKPLDAIKNIVEDIRSIFSKLSKEEKEDRKAARKELLKDSGRITRILTGRGSAQDKAAARAAFPKIGKRAAFLANSGGQVPGFGNKDTVPAILTPGEFVIPKEVVQKIGPDFFEMLKDVRTVKTFNRGGLVTRSTPSGSAAFGSTMVDASSRTNVVVNAPITITGDSTPEQRRRAAKDLVDQIDIELAKKKRNRDSLFARD